MSDWYKKMSFYQIWIRSFADGNGDGIGDLQGVYEKLEYIKKLGVDGIWFSPIYPSPNADFGYDISDYRNIHPDYGTLEDFKRVLEKAHKLGLKVIMDLVVNHTSDEHPWFLESRKGKDNPYSDYYIWRDNPNNWDSLFEGNAWEYDEVRGQYYLHIFAKKQPDLNMDNPAVRAEVEGILKFWLDMGVDGFREDVINFISKKEGLPNGVPFLPAVNGMMHYKDGPHIYEYNQQFRKVCQQYDCFQIGEGPMTTLQSALKYLTGPGKSLDMMFSFDHMMADCMYTEYMHRPFSLIKFKKAISKWQYGLAGRAWNALYLENHDHPRIISRYGSEIFWKESGKMLAAAYLFLQGTPFVYQGQEIGMTNIRLGRIEHYEDVSTKTNFHRYHVKDSMARRLARIHVSSRDSARTPMQWSGKPHAGFTAPDATPWFYVNRNYTTCNVEDEEKDPYSILRFYRRCLSLRRHSKTLIFGEYREHFPKDPLLFVYERVMQTGKGSTRYLVICSFSAAPALLRCPKHLQGRRGQLVLDNYERAEMKPFATTIEEGEMLRPYEVRVYRFKV